MKLLVLAALFVAVALGWPGGENNAGDQSPWPWKVGMLYRYDVETHNLAHQKEGASSGNSYRARFTIRVKSPGTVVAKLDTPERAQIHQELKHHEPMPEDLKYQPVLNLDKPFEISFVGGRVKSLHLDSSVSLAQENFLKGLVGSLQVDLSTHRNVHGSHDTYDNNIKQGLFRKIETDVTGDCETLYTVSPVAAEWRRELPNFASEEEPIEITKSKNYGHCHYRVDYHFGVPYGAEWTGTGHKTRKEQFIKRATVTRILVGKEGPIYKAETTSTVNVHPHMYGKQQAEVHSKVSLKLVSYEKDSGPEWQKPENIREIKSLLYSLTSKQIRIDDSSSSASGESYEKNIYVQKHVNRERRSNKQQKIEVAVDKVILKDLGPDSSTSSSSSESASAYANDDVPKLNEPAYAALYMSPQPHNDKKQNPINAQKLVQEIAQQLQNPNNMPKADFLSKFNILVRILASMSYGQLSQTSRNLEVAKSSNDIVKSDMWMIYRDAVAQAGTLPAFQQIKTWIEKKKIEGEEAAEVYAALTHSLRYPTTEVMKQLFNLAMSPEVTQQMYLNSSAVINVCRLINMAQVNNETVHHYYPTHMYGRLSRKHDRFVVDEVLPRLRQELEKAVEQEDSHKAQVYVKAIGNLGHRDILNIFAPYLEGKIPVSTYLRTRMVKSLQVLAYEKDHHARAVLYSILKNTAEPYEVRVAAIHSIFMYRPTNAMMQAMALMTKEDPDINVRAMLKSIIESAANLKGSQFYEVSKSAEAVKGMLTEEDFGLQYSNKRAREFFREDDGDDEIDLISMISSIGSKDSFFPKSVTYKWRGRLGGPNEDTSFSAAASSGYKVVGYLLDQVFGNNKKNKNPEPQHKYTANKISDILNIKPDDEKPLEASVYVNFMNEQRLFTFNENDVKDLINKLNENLEGLVKGNDYHITKVLNRNQVSVMFPLASGMPFIYKYKQPTLIHVQSKAKGKINPLDREDTKASITLNDEIRYTYAENHDGRVGFLDPLENQYATVGLVSKFQLNIPVKIQLELRSGEIKINLKPLAPEQDTTLVHYSVWPYTANQKKDTLVPFSQDPTTKVISRQNKVVSIDYKFGQQINSLFQVQGYSYSNDFRNIGDKIQYRDYLSSILTIWKQNDVAQTHFNLRYLGKQSKSKGVSFTATYDALYNQKNDGQMTPTASDMKDTSPNSAERREYLVKRVTSGIKSARAAVLDISAKFDSADKLEYALSAAVGDSHVDPKIQFALFAGKNSEHPSQINAVVILKKPDSISPMNFQEALRKELKMEFEADILYNEKENIHIRGATERTREYSNELQQQPLAKQCMEESAKGNFYQHACHKAIIMAHAPDNFKFSVTYKNINPTVRNAAYQVYRIAEGLGMWRAEISPQKVTPDGKLDLTVDVSYLTNTLKLDLNSRYGEMRMKNVPIPKVSSVALATYWPVKPYERVLNYYSNHQFLPYCTIDGSRVRTFSDREYDYKLSRSWHVVMYDNRPGTDEDLVVLARRPNEKSQELYISFSSQSGKNLEIEIKPALEGQKDHVVTVNTNAKKVSNGELTTYWDDVDEIPILEYYKEADNELVLEVREGRVQIIYDGSRFIIYANERRNNNRGICGYMSGDPRDDFRTPYGLIDQPEYYAATYALIEDHSDPKDYERQNKAKKMAYQPEKKYTAILRSDEKWRSEMRSAAQKDWSSEIIYKSRNYLKTKEPCKLKPQVQYYENYGQICITTTALPACQSHCNVESYKVQAAQVVCRPKMDPLQRSYRDQIRRGENPKVTGVPKTTQYRVPGSCEA